MTLNTKSGGIKLTKRETATLTAAMSLLWLIQKHGDDSTSAAAEDAHGKIEAVLESLTPPVEEPAS